MKNDEFFAALRPWSKRKHRLLSKYLEPFIAKVGSILRTRTVYCVDCFAGAAKYDDGSEGSPLLIAHAADKAGAWQNPVTLKLINIEPDNKNFASLEENTKEWQQKGVVENIHSDFESSISTIINKIGISPTLFFVDPFGLSPIPFSAVRKILQRKSITELIINFDADGLRRIADSVYTTSTDFKTVKSLSAKKDLVTSVFGDNSWTAIYSPEYDLSTKERENEILRFYLSNLEKFGYTVKAYPIRESIKKTPKYYFVYCTKHIDGIMLMNDFVRKEEDLIYEETVETLMPLFVNEDSIAFVEDKRRRELLDILKEFLKSYQTITKQEIKEKLMLEKFGQFGSKDYTFAVKTLLENKILVKPDGKSRINNLDTLTVNNR